MSASDETALASDRTALAWTRTALTCILGGAAFARLGGVDGKLDRSSLAVALFLFASGLWLMWCGWHDTRAEGKRLGRLQTSMAADSSMVIVAVLCAMVLIWVWRLRSA
jgi:uncharacterized membrane protein YidH (DUF202 family)